WAYQGVASARVQASRHAQIAAQLQQAKAHYDSGDFQAAAAAYRKIAGNPALTAAAAQRAAAGGQLAKVQIELAKGDFTSAAAALHTLQNNPAAPRQRVRKLLDETSRRAAFAQGCKDIHT